MSEYTTRIFKEFADLDAQSMTRAGLHLKLYEDVSLILSFFIKHSMINTIKSLIVQTINCSSCKNGGYCRIRDEFHLEFCSEWQAREGGDNEL